MPKLQGGNRVAGLVLALLAVTPTGCGGKGDVSGQVKYNNQPLPSGRIVFVCEGGDKPSLTGDIQDGAYTIRGAPVGPARITVATYETKTTAVPNMPKDAAASPPGGAASGPAGKYVPIPARYGDPEKSELTYTIQAGSQTHDVELKP